ncbi:MAG: bifunctional adenosylcobinamide kinase/adenosylcobinamide-phosphate guanylyltransferase [Pseudomonadota bacterium]
MGKSILITGGARSGKSRFAEQTVLAMSDRAIYIATAGAHDAEMADRIARHQARRGAEWRTVTAEIDLVEALRATEGNAPRLVDCLTLWLSNVMLKELEWKTRVAALAETVAEMQTPVVLVTNEVGAGIVPENALARRYRDAAGEMNQTIAAACDEVYLVAAGCPLRIKPNG